ncbi:AI-2E family transporter [Salinibacterium sp. G-O1]|uniref:AI-2E family transporter n=1 Tax=Salinibacterium sp. G-O1 TaxID=3046208 RepID=UPI0024B93772|nr:AI-2E family transporter [Salinibacterium sp. G-O1]MDJ0334423.1 AI-2E family transporter [Salinibacterium sp. G-O1]
MTFGRRKAAQAPAVTLENASGTVPPALRIAGAYSWRILLVVGVLAVVVFMVAQLRDILVPFMVAVLVGALLVPFVQWLMRHRWPKPLAIAVAMLGTIALVTGLIVVVVSQIRSGYPDLQRRSIVAYGDFKQYLADSPFHVDDQQLNAFIEQTIATIQKDSQVLVTGALSVGVTAGHVLAGLLLATFATLFILIDGKRIWAWMVRLFPRTARPAVDGSGYAGWVTLTTFVKVQIFVAAVDATGIGLGAWILGLVFGGFPLVIPIAIAVFLGSFIPVVGALVTGTIAVFIALVYLGPFPAVLMLGIVLLVQQVEGHVLQPLIMGSAVKIHPLAVVFAVAAGSYLAGIPGALFAVPVIAVLNVMVKYIAGGDWKTNPRPTAEDLLPNA